MEHYLATERINSRAYRLVGYPNRICRDRVVPLDQSDNRTSSYRDRILWLACESGLED
jgi:hypothetical protein